MVKIMIHEVGQGRCALTNRDGADGLKVAFDGEEARFLSWKALKQLLAYRMPGKPAPLATPVADRPSAITAK